MGHFCQKFNLRYCLAFAQFFVNFSLVLLKTVLLIKTASKTFWNLYCKQVAVRIYVFNFSDKFFLKYAFFLILYLSIRFWMWLGSFRFRIGCFNRHSKHVSSCLNDMIVSPFSIFWKWRCKCVNVFGKCQCQFLAFEVLYKAQDFIVLDLKQLVEPTFD